MATKQRIVFGSPEAKEVLKKDIARGVVGSDVPGYGKTASRPLRDQNGELIDYGDEEGEGDGIPDMEESFDERASVTMAESAQRSRRVREDLELPESTKPHPRAVPTLLGVRWIPISSIRIDAGTQSRVKLDILVAVEYQTKFESHLADGPESESSHARAWGDFPPVEAFYDEEYWLVDGYHRLSGIRGALERAGLNNVGIGKWLIPCRVFLGTRRDAILYAAGANANHGLRRTNADKRRAVEMVLRDEEWRAWSDAEIARRCAVDPKTVANVRHTLETTLEIPESLVRKAADGRTVNTEKIGVRLEPIYALEDKVRMWLAQEIGETGPNADGVIDQLKNQTREPLKAGSWLDLLDKWIAAQGAQFRKSDLSQAINNVREQRRQAKLQASGRAVYVEPKPESTDDPLVAILVQADDTGPKFGQALIDATLDQLEAALRVISTTDKWRFYKVGTRRTLVMSARDFHVDSFDDAVAPEPIAAVMAMPHPPIDAAPTLDPIVAQLIGLDTPIWTAAPGGLTWAVTHATVEQLQEALTLLPDALRQGRAPVLEAAIKKLGGVVVAEPTPAVVTEPEPVVEPEPVIEDEAEPYGMFTRDWVMDNLTKSSPTSSDFRIALEQLATPDDLREAMASLTTEEKHHVARQKALVARFDELMAPDPRLADAQALLAKLNEAREAARADYERLCGPHLDWTTFERAGESMCGKVAALIAQLTRGTVNA